MSNPIQNNKVFELMQQQGVLTHKTAVTHFPVEEGNLFESLLREQTQSATSTTLEKFGVKLSKHAQKRMEERNIRFEDQDWKAISNGLQQAASKGAKESLFIMDEVALVMSIPNSTVITAVDREQLKDNVFTNIDSAVILSNNKDLEEKRNRLDPLGDLNERGMNSLFSSSIKTKTKGE